MQTEWPRKSDDFHLVNKKSCLTATSERSAEIEGSLHPGILEYSRPTNTRARLETSPRLNNSSVAYQSMADNANAVVVGIRNVKIATRV
jgi:hypothetical protein